MKKETLDRIQSELDSLNFKIIDLERFIRSIEFEKLDFLNQTLLNIQLTTMESYSNILYARIMLNQEKVELDER